MGSNKHMRAYIGFVSLVVVSALNFIGCVEKGAWTGNALVETKYGAIRGVEADSSTWVWKGIPYAKPPIEMLRWKAPQEPDSWEGVRESTESFNQSAQWGRTEIGRPLGKFNGSEDCLYLNIWRPQTEEKNLPIYFWVHGGGNSNGSARRYNGAQLAVRSNMVVVVIQYRLGPFGWFVHPALNREGSLLDKSGNFGTLDIIRALEWVRDNIEAFGGDPDNVTVAGESAGAFNVTNLLISPLAANLFHRAISQSSGVSTVPIERGITRTERTIEKLLVADGRSENREVAKEIRENMSLDEIEDYLRGKNTGEIIEARLTAKGGMGIHNAYEDGVVIPGSLISTIKTGQYNKVPIILGSNESEAKSFLVILGDNMKTSSGHTWSDLRQVLYDEDPPTLDEIMPLPSDREFYEACAFHLSQFWKALFVDSIARELKDKQDNVFGYYFKWGGKGSGPEPADFILGACHALEISLFFGTEGRGRFSLFFTEENRVGREKLQEAMMAYVAQFARTGNPNRSGLGLLPWPEWSHGDGEPKCIIFDATFTEANLGILNEEVSVAKVMSTVNELAPDIRAAVMALARQMR